MKDLDKVKKLMAAYSPFSKIRDIVKLGDVSMLEILLQRTKMDISAVDKEGFNLLYYATIGNNIDTFDYLYEKKPQLLNFKSQSGKNLLHIASIYSCSKITERILCAGNLDINQKDNEGYTALHDSVLLADHKITKMLLQNGADPFIKNEDGLNALELCIEYDNNLKNSEEKIKTTIRRNIKTLLDNGMSLNDISSDGKSFLRKAIEKNNLYIIKLAVAEKTNFSLLDKEKNQLIHYAADEINMNVIKILTCNGVNINSLNSEGKNAMMILAKKGFLSEDLLRFSLSKGLNINAQDKEGNTILHYAVGKVQLGNNNLIKVLLEKGADASIVNNKKKTPIDISVKPYKQLLIEKEKNILHNFISKIDGLIHTKKPIIVK